MSYRRFGPKVLEQCDAQDVFQFWLSGRACGRQVKLLPERSTLFMSAEVAGKLLDDKPDSGEDIGNLCVEGASVQTRIPKGMDGGPGNV